MRCLPLVLMLLTMSARGQQQITKSGTAVVPKERIQAFIPPHSKIESPSSDPSAGTYIVVSRPDLLPPLMKLIRWKRQQGYRVELFCPETRNPDTIRASLMARYGSASAARPAQSFVLLVGDVDRIGAFAAKHTPSGLDVHATDLYYGEYSGDYLPEASVGRLSVADSSELESVVTKIIAYEQGRWADTSRQVLLAAGHEERTPAPTTTNGQVNYLAQLLAQHRPNVDTILFRNPESGSLTDSLLQILSQSNSLVNYTAHCTRNGWNNPNITYRGIDTLGNSIPTVFVNNCCLSNAFDGTCFGEQLLRRSIGGAVGVIGANNESLWMEDYYWAVGAKYPATLNPEYDGSLPGAFDSLLIPTDNIQGYTLGEMMRAGCSSVTLSGSPFDAFYWELYCLLGDPSMTLFFGSSDTLWCQPPDTLTAGSTLLHTLCPPFSRITATQDTSLLSTTISRADGTADLLLTHALEGDSITLTVTRPESIPHIVTLPIVRPTFGLLAATHYSCEDSILRLTVKNVGTLPVVQHHLSLFQDSTCRTDGSRFDPPQPICINHLAPLNDTCIDITLQNYQIGTEPLLSATMTASDNSNNVYSTLNLLTPVPDLRPRIVSIAILDSDMTPATTLLPGHNYHLTATLSHPSDSATLLFDDIRTTLTNPLTCTFPIHIDSNPTHIPFNLTVCKGHWQHTRSGWLPPYSAYERFETGDFSNLPWQHSPTNPWQTDSTQPHNGRYCARSATIRDAQKSILQLDIETLADDSVSFYFKVSSEAHDWLYFYVDGRRRGYWSGNSGWAYYARLLPAGHHQLQWVYQKDASNSERDDCAYLDDIRLPLAIWEQPFGSIEHHTDTLSITQREAPAPCFKLFPNPASETVNIQLNTSLHQRNITVYDAWGRKVDNIFIPSNCNSTQYSTTFLRCGVYTLVLQDDTDNFINKLIVTK